MTVCTSSASNSVEYFGSVIALIRNAYVTDTFARQRQTLGPGVAYDSVFVNCRDESNLCISVGQFSVRFISDDVDWMSVFFALLSQNSSQCFQSFLRVNNTGWVVRGVDNDCLCMYGNQFFHLSHVNLEVFSVSRYNYQVRTVLFNKRTVFREEWCNCHNFGICVSSQCLNYRNQCRGSTAGYEQVGCFDISTETLVQVCSDCFSGFIKTASHGIAVNFDGIGIIKDVFNCLLYFCRSWNAWVTESIVKYVF